MNALTMNQQVLLAAAILAACVTALILLRLSRRHAPAVPRPRPAATTAYLESPDGRIHLPLSGLVNFDLTIGRASTADLIVESAWPHADTVSERHARIYQDSATGCVMIEDLDSTHGVFVNGRRAPHKNILRDRWAVGLGNFTLVYRDGHSDTGPMEWNAP